MPYEKSIRAKKLAGIQTSDTAHMTGIRIRYKGENKQFSAYRIPLEFLVYNRLNGRIAAQVKSFEKQNHALDESNEQDSKVIADLLFESKKDRNAQTMENLLENGQQKFGIVTSDGVIIDGNRRAMLLNRIWDNREKYRQQSRNVDECRFFIAVILPEHADDKEVMRLETSYQMGEDEKLDYDPIQKYLKCKDLTDMGFEPVDIAGMMAEEKPVIEEWLKIMELMDSYLEHYGYDGIYTRLDKREGQFVDLSAYLQRYKPLTSVKVGWAYQAEDVAELKSISFDYIRAQYEGKEFRVIGKPSKTDSAFCNEGIWRNLLKAHEETIEAIQEESVEEIRRKNPGGDLSPLLEERDSVWTEKVMAALKANLGKASSSLEDLQRANEPTKLIEKALGAVNSVRTRSSTFFEPGVFELLKQLSSKCYELTKAHKSGPDA